MESSNKMESLFIHLSIVHHKVSQNLDTRGNGVKKTEEDNYRSVAVYSN